MDRRTDLGRRIVATESEKHYMFQEGGKSILAYIYELSGPGATTTRVGWNKLYNNLGLGGKVSENEFTSLLESYVNQNFGGGFASGRPPEFFKMVLEDSQKLKQAILAQQQQEQGWENQRNTEKAYGRLTAPQMERLVHNTFSKMEKFLSDKGALVDTDGSPEGVFLSPAGERHFEKALSFISEKSGLSLQEVHELLDNPMQGEWGRHLDRLASDWEAD